MRGQVLGVDRETGDGQIAGDNGERYVFRPGDWADRVGPAIGAQIDFEADDRQARKIYRVPGSYVPLPPPPGKQHNRFVAAVLAFFVGFLGIHRFYLGRTGSGIVMLALSICVIGLPITGIWAIVDMIRYLVMSDAEFAARYDRA